MKNRINLFRRKPQVDYLSSHASLFKRYLTSAGIVLFIFFIFLMVQVFSLNKSLQDLLQKKGTYLQYLLSEKDIEANMLYFKSKQTQMNTFMKDDAHFVPYYQVLKSSLGQTGSNVVLDTIDIDKSRNTKFIVKIKNYESMLAFLRYIEAEDFLKNFISLSLQSFTLNKTSGGQYQLELQGVFKELNLP